MKKLCMLGVILSLLSCSKQELVAEPAPKKDETFKAPMISFKYSRDTVLLFTDTLLRQNEYHQKDIPALLASEGWVDFSGCSVAPQSNGREFWLEYRMYLIPGRKVKSPK